MLVPFTASLIQCQVLLVPALPRSTIKGLLRLEPGAWLAARSEGIPCMHMRPLTGCGLTWDIFMSHAEVQECHNPSLGYPDAVCSDVQQAYAGCMHL